jgi:hypothetical protein
VIKLKRKKIKKNKKSQLRKRKKPNKIKSNVWLETQKLNHFLKQSKFNNLKSLNLLCMANLRMYLHQTILLLDNPNMKFLDALFSNHQQDNKLKQHRLLLLINQKLKRLHLQHRKLKFQHSKNKKLKKTN